MILRYLQAHAVALKCLLLEVSQCGYHSWKRRLLTRERNGPISIS